MACVAKWMTLPYLSGNRSQLHSEFCSGFFLGTVWVTSAKVAGATTTASNYE